MVAAPATRGCSLHRLRLQVCRVLCLDAIDAEVASERVGGMAAAAGRAVVAALLKTDTPRSRTKAQLAAQR